MGGAAGPSLDWGAEAMAFGGAKEQPVRCLDRRVKFPWSKVKQGWLLIRQQYRGSSVSLGALFEAPGVLRMLKAAPRKSTAA